MSLRLCILYIVNKHLYAFYIYMHNLSRADGLKSTHHSFLTTLERDKKRFRLCQSSPCQ